MLLRAQSTASVVLLDFLAPNLARAASTTSNLPRPRFRSRPGFANAPRLNYDPTVVDPATLKFSPIDQVTAKGSPPQCDVSEPEKKADAFHAILLRLNKAVGDKDIQTVLQQWQKLERNDLVPLLSPWDFKRISQFCVASFLPHTNTDPWDATQRKMVEQVAVSAAASHITDALVAVMLHYIKCNDPEAVLFLYNQCRGMMGDKGVWGDEQNEETSEVEDLPLGIDKPLSNVMPLVPGRVKILLAATAAYAILNNFTGALTMYTQSIVRFQHYTTKEFLSALDHDRALQKRMDTYVRRLETARLVSRPPSLSTHVIKLGDTNNVKQLQKLLASILEGITGPEPYIAADVSLVTPSMPVAMTEVGYNSFLTAFFRCYRKDLAGMLWEQIPKLGLTHRVSMWTTLIDASAKTGSFSDALGTWDMMLSSGTEPEALSHRALIAALFNGRRPRLAMEQFARFQHETVEKSFSSEQILVVYNTVITGLLHNERIGDALRFLQGMEGGEPKPDVVSYNAFLADYARKNDLHGISDIIDKMAASGTSGDVYTFSTVLSALLKMGRDDATELVLSMMEQQGISPNVATFTAIIDWQLKERDERNLRGALKLLTRMESNPKLQPNEVTYTAILAGVHRGTWLPDAKAEQVTDYILQRMEQRDVKLGPRGHTILIRGWLNRDAVQKALAQYREMRSKGSVLIQTWHVLLSGLITRGEWELADEVVRDIRMDLGYPNGQLLELVKQVRQRKRGKR
ncbi:pentatricopeptide repeat-containing protein [Moniliophthora roreri]|uniref:Pentatricopeptide repeat-containing protein n=1 Tax=Moniliophthora roreri TaxID=221103 RepID=A0A0W0FH31_MONRR|nr:pentatricopeptide repeat-containing protein [Moniliophthora roreri]